MNSGVRRLADLRREAMVAARELQGDPQPLDARDLKTLLGLSSAVAAAPSLEELLDFAADTAVSALGAASVSISRWEIEREILRTLVNTGQLAPGEIRHPTDEIYRLSGDDPLKEMLLGGQSHAGMLDDPGLHPLERSLLERLGVRSCAAVPIMVGNVAWGELWATRDADPFSHHDLQLLGAIAGQVAAGVARAELFSRLSTLAFEDELTGLANRAALQERMELAFDRLEDGWGEVTLLLCDVDNLKRLNDMRGHHGGDWALKAVATALRREVEALPDALVCRLSGDEFCVLAEGAGPDQVQRVGEATIGRLDGHRPRVGLSCGVASTRLGLGTASELFGAADGALYAAKRAGRGGVSVADAEPARSGRSIGRPGARRGRRDGLEVDTGTMIAQGLALLDGALRAAAPLERLEGLATFVGSSLRASKAAVSLCTHGGGYVETLFKLDLRSGHSTSVRYGVDGDRYALADYPRTEELLVAGGSTHIHGNDPEADPAERAILERLGACDVLLAGAADGRGAWLLEIYGDVDSADLALADGVLRLLCAHAVHPAVGLRAERRATGSLRAVTGS